MKIKLISVLLMTGVVGYSFWQLSPYSETIPVEFKEAIMPATNQDKATTVDGKVLATMEAMGIADPVEPIASVGQQESNLIPIHDTTGVIETEDELDPDAFSVDFAGTGEPEKIMEFFAEQRRARAELVENQMSGEISDPEWSMDLVQRFEASEKLVPGLSGLNLAEADCRETICALHFSFDAGTSYKEMEPIMSNIGIVLGTEVWVHHDAVPEGPVVYVAQASTSLPDLE